MSKFLEKYSKANQRKFIETPLPVQPVLYPDKISGPVRVSPMTIEMEMRYYQTLMSLADKSFPIEILMFDDILEDIVFSQDPKHPLEYDYLTQQDISFIAYNMRMQSYGETIKTKVMCPECYKFYTEYNQLEDKSQEKVNELIKLHKIKHFNQQEMLAGKEFYTKTAEIPLTNYTIEFPNKFDDVVRKYVTYSNVELGLTMTRFGWYTQLKKYLLDFRLALQEFYPDKVNQPEEEIDRISDLYKNYSFIQLSVYSIDGEIVNIEDVSEIPIVLRRILNTRDVDNIQNTLKEFSKYKLTINYDFKCDKCQHKEVIDATSFPFEYIFGVKN